MTRHLIIILLMAGVITGQVAAQGDLTQSVYPHKPGASLSLFSADRLKMTQSYSLWFASSRSGTRSVATYLNCLEYQVAEPLKVYLNFGYLHYPGAIANRGKAGLQTGQVLPGIAIDWRPAGQLRLRLAYQYYPPYLDAGWLFDRQSEETATGR